MSFLSNLLGTKKSKSVIGLDVGSSSLKVVQLRKERGGAVLETYGELALGPYAGLQVGQATNWPGHPPQKYSRAGTRWPSNSSFTASPGLSTQCRIIGCGSRHTWLVSPHPHRGLDSARAATRV